MKTRGRGGGRGEEPSVGDCQHGEGGSGQEEEEERVAGGDGGGGGAAAAAAAGCVPLRHGGWGGWKRQGHKRNGSKLARTRSCCDVWVCVM